MGLFDALIGNASEVNIQELEKEYAALLGENETIERAYKLIRDMFIFTNKRLMMVDKQGLTGKKCEYHSIPYKSITHFCIETSGHFDLEAELKIWITGDPVPIAKQFNRSLNIYALQAVLATYVSK
ncbi:MAG: PH domain-containing protein [Syntrophomonas sp.]